MKYTEQIDLLELEIMKFNQSDSRRIQHLVKVHRFAQLIGHMEKLDAHTQFLTECAALVHDIGIRPAEEKYGASTTLWKSALVPLLIASQSSFRASSTLSFK